MVTLPVPVLVRITGSVLLLPSTTLPKLVLAGEALTRRVMPVPESDTVVAELLALLTMEMPPETLPAAVGAKMALKVALFAAARVNGSDRPLMLNPVPVALA